MVTSTFSDLKQAVVEGRARQDEYPGIIECVTSCVSDALFNFELLCLPLTKNHTLLLLKTPITSSFLHLLLAIPGMEDS